MSFAKRMPVCFGFNMAMNVIASYDETWFSAYVISWGEYIDIVSRGCTLKFPMSSCGKKEIPNIVR